MRWLGFDSFRVWWWRLYSMMSRRWPGLNLRWAVADPLLTKVFINPNPVTRGAMIRTRPRLRVIVNSNWPSAKFANREEPNPRQVRSVNG